MEGSFLLSEKGCHREWVRAIKNVRVKLKSSETANRKTEELDAAREGIIRAHANIQFNENTKYYSQQFFRFPTPLWSKNGLLSAASFVFRNHRAEFATQYLLLCDFGPNNFEK